MSCERLAEAAAVSLASPPEMYCPACGSHGGGGGGGGGGGSGGWSRDGSRIAKVVIAT